jgi:hypothetical protein
MGKSRLTGKRFCSRTQGLVMFSQARRYRQRNVFFSAVHFTDPLDSVHGRHAHIHQNQVRLMLAEFFQRRLVSPASGSLPCRTERR